MMRLAIVMCVLVSGCVSQIQQVDPNWDGTTEPRCTDSYGPVGGDGVAAGLVLGIGLPVADGTSDRDTGNVIAVGSLVVGVAFAIAIASFVGEERVKDCKTAKAAWAVGGAVNRRATIVPAPPPAPLAPPPRGFFCASSPTKLAWSICTRERAVCEQTRDAALAAVLDLSSCTLVETAWCYTPADGRQRCSATGEACAARRDAAGAGSGSGATCSEVR